jgi:ATP-dependent RNA helicase DeaD
VQLCRQRLPAAEEITDPGLKPPRRESTETSGPRAQGPSGATPAPGATFAPGAWFHVSVGRAKGADPKWLLPMLCKRGGVARQDIGPIRIFERETKVQVSDQAASDFARAVHGTEVQGVRIEPLDGPTRAARTHPRGANPAKQGRGP